MIAVDEDAISGDADRRGRRRRAMIDAARALFIERGYEAVSLGDIVRRSGGSLSTLYDLFENKQGLLAAVVEDDRSDKMERIDAVLAAELDPATKLSRLAGTFHDHHFDPTTLGMIRVVLGEGLRNPQFARQLYETVHRPLVARLSALFADWDANGLAHIPEPEEAAQLFLGLLLHGQQMRAFFCEPQCVKPLPRDQAVREATRLFLAGYQIGQGKA